MRPSFPFSILILLTACSSNDLSRARAAALVAEHVEFATVDTAVQIDDSNLNLGFTMGLWQRTRGFGPPGIELAPAGGKFFKSAGFQMLAPVATPLEPIRRRVVEITGIADTSQATKEVQFIWDYDALPAWLVKLEKNPNINRTATAFFRLYDDGWRVERLDIKSNARFGIDVRALPGAADIERHAVVGAWSAAIQDIPYVCLSSDGKATFGDRPEELVREPWCRWAPDGTGTCQEPDGPQAGRTMAFRWSIDADSLSISLPSEGFSATYRRDNSLRCFFRR